MTLKGNHCLIAPVAALCLAASTSLAALTPLQETSRAVVRHYSGTVHAVYS